MYRVAAVKPPYEKGPPFRKEFECVLNATPDSRVPSFVKENSFLVFNQLFDRTGLREWCSEPSIIIADPSSESPYKISIASAEPLTVIIHSFQTAQNNPHESLVVLSGPN